MKTQITIISSFKTGFFFFSKDHCQEHNLGETYVPVTHYLPATCAPRPSVPDGFIKTIEQLLAVYYYDYEEIPNPDPTMQP